MVANLKLLENSYVVQPEISKKVYMSNGDISCVTHVGASKLPNKSIISNVFHLPQFKFNLSSVSKLTKELSCSATFFLDFFIFQELFNGKVK